MKAILVSFLVLSSLTAQAKTIKAGSEILNYTCADKTTSDLKFNIKITASEDAALVENTKVPATLTIKRIVPFGSEVKIIPVVYAGKYQYEDVVSSFVSSDGNTEFTLYADELDQTVLTTIFNKKSVEAHYDCN